MIKKRKKDEIDVHNINPEVVNFFYTQDLLNDTSFYKPQPFINENCVEEIDTNIENLQNNIKRLENIRDTENIEVNPEDINVFIIEYVIQINETNIKKRKKNIKKADKKLINDEKKLINDDKKLINDEKKLINDDKKLINDEKSIDKLSDNINKEDVLDLLVNIATSKIVDTSFDKTVSDSDLEKQPFDTSQLNDTSQASDTSDISLVNISHLTSLSTDKRLLYFLKKSNPGLLKMCEDEKEFFERNEAVMYERGKINYAFQEYLGKITPMKKIPCKIEDIREKYWTDTEKSKFKHLVLKYKNNFDKINEVLVNKSRKDIILRYYCNKDKTYDHIKKKSGRISDSECKDFVNGTWSEIEKTLFNENYPKYGKSLVKYQGILPKTMKELKIYMKWYLKNGIQVQPKTFLSDWSIDERQIFAIYYPFYNKNWITMSGHFSSKSSKDLKIYYTKYFKNLSFNEQKFETYIKEYNLKSNTDPVLHKGEEQNDWNETIGWIFKTE